MSGIKAEIEAAAIATITCPSCKAKPSELCHYIGHGGGLCRIRKVKTHQRRLSAFISSEHCRFSTSKPVHVITEAANGKVEKWAGTT